MLDVLLDAMLDVFFRSNLTLCQRSEGNFLECKSESSSTRSPTNSRLAIRFLKSGFAQQARWSASFQRGEDVKAGKRGVVQAAAKRQPGPGFPLALALMDEGRGPSENCNL